MKLGVGIPLVDLGLVNVQLEHPLEELLGYFSSILGAVCQASVGH